MNTKSNFFNLVCLGVLVIMAMQIWSLQAPAPALAMAPSAVVHARLVVPFRFPEPP